jgi:hypothetical protein
MAEPDRPPGHRSLFDFGVRRVAEKRPPPEVDWAEVERDVEAKRQARKQREQDAAAAAAAAKWPVGPGPRIARRLHRQGRIAQPPNQAGDGPSKGSGKIAASAAVPGLGLQHRPVRAPTPAHARACEHASRLDGGRDCLCA